VTNVLGHEASRSACFDTTDPASARRAASTPIARGGSATSQSPRHSPLSGSNRKGPKETRRTSAFLQGTFRTRCLARALNCSHGR
jgi:hypothetical protein